MLDPARYECYTDYWRRTGPDLVVYLPKKPGMRDGYGDHFLVDFTPGGDLLAIWTQASQEGAKDLRVVCARSLDDGFTWSEPSEIDGPNDGIGLVCSFGFPLMSRSGRVYCMYNKHLGITDGGYSTGVMRCKYSDDDGRTWQDGGVDIPYRKTRFDHPRR